MTPKDFKTWRKGVMRMSQKEAAEALGLKRRVVQYYEKGERDGDSLEIPKSVRLACFALAQGVTDYHGPGQVPEGAPPDPAAGSQPAPDEIAGSKKRKKAAKVRRKAAGTPDGGAGGDGAGGPDTEAAD
ncbi:helix-turn-helix domain-containing protein [Roseospira goensis]|uniref:DNA-binding XRE family transcriptional regulator n=1 Tax=Roseospira goensis TaxID=391922 RepID=A0A7W6WJ49_9PROT|nr:helix-turn-helix transcriptional regulator [Roseospira goensis]MBB4284339.1 DNA-binding XRE family transcriptional regulator [Roseospira goensis]